jgi:hypothetical protein
MIWNRLTEYTEEIIGYYQNGFRTNRGTIENIHVLRQIIEQAYEYNMQIGIMCIRGNSKSFRTFIFSRETVREGGAVIGRV